MVPTAGVYRRISCNLKEFPMAINQVKSVAEIPSEVLETVRKAYLTFKRNQEIRGKSG